MTHPQSGTPAPEVTTKPAALGVALIAGRIAGKARKWKGNDGVQKYSTLVKLPNPDEFSNAGTVEVQSLEPLGEVGDTWRGKVRISGSVRPFQYTDRASGEIKSGTDCTIRLTAE